MKNHVRNAYKIGRIFMVVLILLVVAAFLAQTSFAKQFSQILGIDPDEGAETSGQTTGTLAGNQPDQDGYTGPLPAQADNAEISENSPDGLLKAFQPPAIDAPDSTGYQGELPAPAAPMPITGDDPDNGVSQQAPVLGEAVFNANPNAEDYSAVKTAGWSAFYYLFAAGSSLHSADYSMPQVYNSGACASVIDTTSQFLTLNMDLPDGARIDYLRIFFYDTSASDSSASLRKYDGAGNFTLITSISSSGTGGFDTNLSAYSGAVVDNSDGGYVLNWLPNVTGTTMRLCGLRVAYRLPE